MAGRARPDRDRRDHARAGRVPARVAADHLGRHGARLDRRQQLRRSGSGRRFRHRRRELHDVGLDTEFVSLTTTKSDDDQPAAMRPPGPPAPTGPSGPTKKSNPAKNGSGAASADGCRETRFRGRVREAGAGGADPAAQGRDCRAQAAAGLVLGRRVGGSGGRRRRASGSRRRRLGSAAAAAAGRRGRLGRHRLRIGSGRAARRRAQAILQTTSTQEVVTVQLDATKQSEAVVGEPVTVELPDGSTVNGKITQVSPVAQSSSSGSGSGSGPAGRGSGRQRVEHAVGDDPGDDHAERPLARPRARPGGGQRQLRPAEGEQRAVGAGDRADRDAGRRIRGPGRPRRRTR